MARGAGSLTQLGYHVAGMAPSALCCAILKVNQAQDEGCDRALDRYLDMR